MHPETEIGIMNDAEHLLYEKLNNLPIAYSLKIQYPIGHYYLDFAYSEIKFGIDTFNEIFYSEPYMSKKKEKLQSWGWSILNFRDKEIIDNLNLVYNQIETKIKEYLPIYNKKIYNMGDITIVNNRHGIITRKDIDKNGEIYYTISLNNGEMKRAECMVERCDLNMKKAIVNPKEATCIVEEIPNPFLINMQFNRTPKHKMI